MLDIAAVKIKPDRNDEENMRTEFCNPEGCQPLAGG